jgi:ligand-binding sensor domain-containing protein
MPATLNAERLPIRAYSTADGLPHNTVMRIVRDSHGFLWFCTLRGLARFDGYTFQNYDAGQGLRGSVTDVLETRAGEYWIATLNGLYRFHPSSPAPHQETPNSVGRDSAAEPIFESFSLNDDGSPPGINTLHEDRRGTVWAATNEGLYRLVRSNGRWTPQLFDLAVAGKPANGMRVLELMEDHDGALWISLPQTGLRQLLPDGRINSYSTRGRPAELTTAGSFERIVTTMLEDHDGRVWLASDRGLTLLVRRPGSAQLDWARTYTSKDGLRDDNVTALVESTDGRLWAGTRTGLSQFCAASDCGGNSFRSFGEFVGRFSIETFAVAQGTGPAPVIFDQPPFPDADSNPPFEPIHTYHLGLWFGSPDEAVAAGCPGTVTRFNGEHMAGIQVLNTANFPDLQGPLLHVQ